MFIIFEACCDFMNKKLIYWNSQGWSDNCCKVIQSDMDNSLFINNDNIAGGG